jgi:hypothetical protein
MAMSNDNPNVVETPDEDPRENDPDAEGESLAAAAREHGVEVDSLITADEEGLPRDADGNIKAEAVDVAKLGGTIITEPILPDEHSRIVDPFLTDPEKGRITNAEMADLLDAHLVVPDLTKRPTCPDDHVSEAFVREDLSEDRQLGYLIGMCEVGRQYESAKRLRGEVPEAEQDLLLKVLESDTDIDDIADQGNRQRGPTRR